MRLPMYKQVWWWGGGLVLLALILWGLGSTITPFLVGIGIAYLLDPLADRLERGGLARVWAVTLITLIALLTLVAIMVVVIPTAVRQATQLAMSAPEMLDRAEQLIVARWPDAMERAGSLRELLDTAASSIAASGTSLAKAAVTQLGSLLSVVMFMIIAPVVAFYMLLDWDHMVARVDELLPREHADTLRRIASEIDSSLAGFVRGQGMVIGILGTFYCVSLLAVGLPYGLAIGISAALLSFIPYVGTVLGAVLSIGVAVAHFWDQPGMIAVVAGIFVTGQMVESNYLQPKIVGHHVGVHPVWLLLALAVFGALFGFVGLLVAVPLAAMIGVVARFGVARYRESALYTGREVPPPPAQPTLIELVPRGTVAEARARAQRVREAVVEEVRLDEAHREAARVAEEAAKAKGAHAVEATVVVNTHADRTLAEGKPQVVAVTADGAPVEPPKAGSA